MQIENWHDELMEQPYVQQIINRVQQSLNEEQRDRQKFREWLTDEVKAEFINGEIVLHSPVIRYHLWASQRLSTLLEIYVTKNDLGEVSTEKALIGLTRNDYEPDVAYWTKQQAASFVGETKVHPAPTFIVEILSRGTKKKDRGIKFDDYAAHGIEEYLIIEPKKFIIEQYVLPTATATAKKYELLKEYKVGDNYASKVIAGFKIPVAALFDKQIYVQTLAKF